MDASCLTSSHRLKLGGTVLRSSAHILSVSSADGYDVIFRAMTRKPATTVSSSAFASGGLARATQTKAVSGREGASSSGRKLEMAVASNVIPHPDKVDKGREDADFISLHTDVLDDDEQAAADSKCLTNTAVICVADGVGGWADEGVDPALHSREFVGHIESALNMAHDQVVENPRLLLHMAHSATAAEGAATAIVGVMDESGLLKVANLGDCGCRVVRRGQIVFASQPLQHFFDCPYQFGSESSDTADKAKVYEVQLQAGDTLVMGSDGLFDNVFDRDLAAVVSIFGGRDEVSAARTSAALAALAAKKSLDTAYESPYVVEAVSKGQDLPLWQRVLGKKLMGGKPDDITVVVAHVVAEGESDEDTL
eukprot:TRINITY_DN1348_c0_g1_i3.p1 TRINITY_DN1348_c0_g1~~TRINITY_DN1348_c0_g1_i3.p1  ORF type:complete len:367 (-),score=97.07 TRINITY_DN1348_c0_g1_i3:41-1141(-)